MGFFNRGKSNVQSVNIEEIHAWRSDEYARILPLLRESNEWLHKVINKKAYVTDKTRIESLVQQIEQALERSK